MQQCDRLVEYWIVDRNIPTMNWQFVNKLFLFDLLRKKKSEWNDWNEWMNIKEFIVTFIKKCIIKSLIKFYIKIFKSGKCTVTCFQLSGVARNFIQLGGGR